MPYSCVIINRLRALPLEWRSNSPESLVVLTTLQSAFPAVPTGRVAQLAEQLTLNQ